MNLTILLGLHNYFAAHNFSNSSSELGYAPEIALDLPEMLVLMQRNTYDAYVMDINLGRPAAEWYEPAKQVYEILQPRIISGTARFVAISNNRDTVYAARDKSGIPTQYLFYEPDLGYHKFCQIFGQ